jgi:hypothetical protein
LARGTLIHVCQKLVSFEKTGLMFFVPDGLLKALYAVQGNGMPSGS